MPTLLDYAAFRQRFLDSGEWIQGELHCRDSLALADDPGTWQQLGLVLAHRAHKADAEIAFSNAARLDPQSARTHYWLGKLADERGDFDAATTRYETALACDPGFEPARFAAQFNAVARREIAYAREQTGDVVLQGAVPRFLLIKAWGAGFWSEILHLLGGAAHRRNHRSHTGGDVGRQQHVPRARNGRWLHPLLRAGQPRRSR